MHRNDRLNVKALVIEEMPKMIYRVQLPNGHRVLARVSSELRLSFIKVLPGEHVLVEFSPYDLSRGRIIARLEKEQKI